LLRDRELYLPRLVIVGAVLSLGAFATAQETPEPAAPEKAAPAEPEEKAPAPTKAPAEKKPSAEPTESGDTTPTAPEPPKKKRSKPVPAPTEVQAPTGADQNAKTALRPEEEELLQVARLFFVKLLKRDTEGASNLCRTPFFFEGKAVNSADDLKRRWAAAINSRPAERLVLYGIDVLTPEAMEAKYGKAPTKLASWPIKGGMFTVANLSGQAAVVLWKKNGSAWAAIAYHD
jgi:hypothetical protein